MNICLWYTLTFHTNEQFFDYSIKQQCSQCTPFIVQYLLHNFALFCTYLHISSPNQIIYFFVILYILYKKKTQKNQGLSPTILEVTQAPTLAMAIKNVGRIINFKKSIPHLVQYLKKSSTEEQEACGNIFSISNGVKN